MEKEIRIKDLIFSIWDQKLRVGIAAGSIFVVLFLSLFIYSGTTSSYRTVIEMDWDGIEKLEYPDGTRFLKTDIVSQDNLEKVKDELKLDIEVDNLYRDGLLNVNVTTQSSEGNSNSFIQVEIIVEMSSLSLSEDEANNFVNNLIDNFKEDISLKSTLEEPNLTNYNIGDNQELIEGYDSLRDALNLMYENMTIYSNDKPGFKVNGKSSIQFKAELSELYNDLFHLETLMVKNDTIYSYLSENELKTYIENLGLYENRYLTTLYEEKVELDAILSSSSSSNPNQTVIDRLVVINEQIRDLEEITTRYEILKNKIENTFVVLVPTDSIIKEFNDLKLKLETVIDENNDFSKEYNEEKIYIGYQLQAGYEINGFGSILYYFGALIAAIGMPIVVVWTFEDWEKRLS